MPRTREFTQDDHDRARRIAAVALNRAIAGDLPDAAKYVERLNGTPGLLVAIKGWVDTYIGNVHPDHKLGEPMPIAWLDVDGGGVVRGADSVPPSARWAGRLIAARAADDEAGFVALLRAPAEGAELGDGITALLSMVALGINRHREETRPGG